MGRAWLRLALTIPEIEIVALVDTDVARAEAFAKAFELEGIAVSPDLEGTLVRTTPDLLFDVTVPESHEAVVTAALAHGCHVMGEKPLAASLAAAQRMVAAAERAGRRYGVMQNRRWHPQLHRFQRLLEHGELGEITTLYSDFLLGPHFGGFRDAMEHPLLLDMAIHTFDAARFLTGADPVAVSCHVWNPAGSWYAHGASAVATFEMSGGLVFGYRGSWCAEGLPTSWEASWRAIGSRGSATWDGHDAIAAEVVAEGDGFERSLSTLDALEVTALPFGEGHEWAIRQFVDALVTGGEPATPATDNIRSVAMVFAAIESAERGERVEVRV
jgi:predicted dehydrogenase